MKVKKIFDISSKAFYLSSVALGSVFLSVGSAFAGGLKFRDEWNSVNGYLPSIKLIALNSYTALSLGGFLVILGTIGTYFDQSKQQNQNDTLALENNGLKKSLNKLEKELNSTQEELQEQKNENRKLNGDLVTLWLKAAFNTLEFNSTERITIYYEYNNTFFLLARYSKNPLYNNIHRQKFPLTEGVISKAWQHGFHVEANCPVSSSKQYKGYLAKHYDYTEDKITSLTMKSCRYVALAIADAATHIGIIVFESTEASFLQNDTEVKIKKYFDDYQGQLSKFIRDGLELDREINIRRNNTEKSVEEEFIQALKGGGV